MKELDHSKVYYKGLGNADYSECLDRIANMWKYICLAIVFTIGVFIASSLAIYTDNIGMTWIMGIYLGLFVSFLCDCFSTKKKFDLRLKEIKGE